MAWNVSRATELKASNPLLANASIATPRPGSPYFVWGVTMLGPSSDSPFMEGNRSYTLLGGSSCFLPVRGSACRPAGVALRLFGCRRVICFRDFLLVCNPYFFFVRCIALNEGSIPLSLLLQRYRQVM